MLKSVRCVLVGIALVAFMARLVMRLHSGSADFWENGYSFYFDLARSIAAGKGLAFEGESLTAFRVPGYPLFLAAVTLGRHAFFPIVFAQSAVGAASVLCVGLLSADLFGTTAAVPAATLAAAYPYYVIHDTAMQETSLVTFLTLVAVLLIIRARREMSPTLAALAGLVLAADVMTRATVAPFAASAVGWIGWTWQGPLGGRIRAALVCGAMLVLGLTPWLLRSYKLTGSARLGTETGYELWRGNNPRTFSYYPIRSIDLETPAAFAALSGQDQAELNALGSNEALRDGWFARRGLRFIREHPWLTAVNGLRKIIAAFSWLPSPRRTLWPTLIQLVSYGPIMILGLLGMLMNGRRSWREHSVIYSLFLSFMVVTALFFAHTSHRSYLDVYWIAFAGYVLARWSGRLTLSTKTETATKEG